MSQKFGELVSTDVLDDEISNMLELKKSTASIFPRCKVSVYLC
jgi:hypothetical protein